jgi:hypothetical protein
MTSTIVKDSIVGDGWIQQTAQAVPVRRVVDPATGQETGDILTGPVRLSFVNLFKLPPKRPDQTSEPKFGATLLFTPYADMRLMSEDYYKICATEFAHKYNPADGQYYGLRSPFRNQAEKSNLNGYTPGCIFLNCTSKFKPPIVDIRNNPIVDESKVYAGVWAICSIRAYAYKDPKNQGVAFGLQSVMIIGDDTHLAAGGAPDTGKTFAGVNVAAPIVRPEIVNAMPMGGQAPAHVGIPGYTQPGYSAPQAATSLPPAMPPAQGFNPVQPQYGQAQQGFTPAVQSDEELMRQMLGQ